MALKFHLHIFPGIWKPRQPFSARMSLLLLLKGKYPDTNWVHVQHNGFGPTDPKTEGEMLAKANALIGGQSW